MFDLGWTELLLIGLVALIVVGPKDLPGMFRTLGQFTAKIKRMAREFSRAMEAAADEAGVSEVEKTLRAASNPAKAGMEAVSKAVDPDRFKPGSATQKLAEERAEAAKKIHEATAKKEAAKRAAEAEAAKAEAASKSAAAETPAASSEVKAKAKAPAKAAAKPAAKKSAAKKVSAKKPTAKKSADKKAT